MAEFINVADLTDPSDPQGRTYRQVNAERQHAIPVGALVELKSGERLFVKKHTRDCDMEPLYSLGLSDDDDLHDWSHGHGEESLKPVSGVMGLDHQTFSPTGADGRDL